MIVFVRGKNPSDEILEMAVERGIAILRSQHTLFDACGILYFAGLKGKAGVMADELTLNESYERQMRCTSISAGDASSSIKNVLKRSGCW